MTAARSAHIAAPTPKSVKKSTSLEIQEAAPDIAKAVLEIVLQYPSAPDDLQSYYRGVLNWMMRLLEHFVEPRVSKAAQKEADARGIGELRQYRWRDWRKQVTLMRDPGRKTFHWEHSTPASDMIKSILAQKTPTAKSIAAVLETITIAWITKDENSRLTHRNRHNWID